MVHMVFVLFMSDLVEKVNVCKCLPLSHCLLYCVFAQVKYNKWKALVDLVASFQSYLFGTVSASLSQVAEHDWSNCYVHFLWHRPCTRSSMSDLKKHSFQMNSGPYFWPLTIGWWLIKNGSTSSIQRIFQCSTNESLARHIHGLHHDFSKTQAHSDWCLGRMGQPSMAAPTNFDHDWTANLWAIRGWSSKVATVSAIAGGQLWPTDLLLSKAIYVVDWRDSSNQSSETKIETFLISNRQLCRRGLWCRAPQPLLHAAAALPRIKRTARIRGMIEMTNIAFVRVRTTVQYGYSIIVVILLQQTNISLYTVYIWCNML